MTSFIQGLTDGRINFEPDDPYYDKELLQVRKINLKNKFLIL